MVISFDCHENRPDKDLIAFIKKCFSQRRKTLTNALANAPYMNVTREKVAEVLAKMGKDVMVRGERLSPAEFGQLSNLLSVYL